MKRPNKLNYHGSGYSRKMYPVLGSKKQLADLKSIALRFDPNEAIRAGQILMDAGKAALVTSETVIVTGFRANNHYTVTSQ
jgi:hypothetical protein